MVERPNNYVFGNNMTPPPKAPGGRSLSYKICALFMYSICYWEVWIHFLSGKGKTNFFLGRLSSGENFPSRGKFPGGELFGGNCMLGGFTRIPVQNFFIFLAFSLLTQFYMWLGMHI